MTTINKEEIQNFSKLADQWWDENGDFSILISEGIYLFPFKSIP